MGNEHSGDRGNRFVQQLSFTTMAPPKFHTLCSDNVTVSRDKKQATRKDSFCEGICFTDRKVKVGESLYLHILIASSNWHGSIRVGFTTQDPSTINKKNLPRYLCPDLVNRPGFWAKPLPQEFCDQGFVIEFSVDKDGAVYAHSNGRDRREFVTQGVDVNKSLWGAIDIYGNASTVQFGDSFAPIMNVVPQIPTGTALGRSAVETRLSDNTQPKIYQTAAFDRLNFHRKAGKNIALNGTRDIATRSTSEYSNGYLFTSRPMQTGEAVVLLVLGVDPSYTGGMAVGMTACDPNSLVPTSFPEDSNGLLDRSEYWVVRKSFSPNHKLGDELAFSLTEEGQLIFSRNGVGSSGLMHVDRSVPLYLFWDIFGVVCKVKMLGSTKKALEAPDSQDEVLADYDLPDETVGSTKKALEAPDSQYEVLADYDLPDETVSAAPETKVEQEVTECPICMEEPKDTVVVPCGHLCMCFACAQRMHQSSSPCPICRGKIQNIVKTYSS